MLPHLAEITCLTLLIERLLDAEMLPDSEGATLLSETDAARQSLEAGDLDTTRTHLAQVALFTDTLIKTGALAPSDGRAVIQAANAVLNPEREAADATR